jgi:hypothetical protein
MADAECVRKLAFSFPHVRERLCYGTPAFYVKRVLFARFLEDGDSVVIKIDKRDRDRRVACDPKAFYVTDHYLSHPMMIVRLSAVGEDDLRELLNDAWKHATG